MEYNVKMISTLFIIFLIAIPHVQAESVRPHGIVVDGTIGTSGEMALQGPDFEIKPEYGEQQGSNLFHSFEKFNLYASERARFTGPETVQNIISRVTGGEYSWINGTIASEIPDANLYFLNPSGVIFGPDSSLDIEGSFHVSTADYLSLGQMDRFHSDMSTTSVLASSPPIAFGFLDNNFSEIRLKGKGEIHDESNEDQATGLVVQTGKTISFISGAIEIKQGAFYRTTEIIYDNNDPPYATDVSIKLGSLTAPQGQINLIGVSSPGEVNIHDFDVSMIKFSGNINVLSQSLLDVNAGDIYIRGGDVLVDDSVLRANSTIDNTSNRGEIVIHAENITFSHGATIFGNTYGSGKGSDILLKASNAVKFFQSNPQGEVSKIILNTFSTNKDAGHGGNITIDARDIVFENGASIYNMTFGHGNVGKISMIAWEKIDFSGINNEPFFIFLQKRMFGVTRRINPGGIFSIVLPWSNGGNCEAVSVKGGDITLNNTSMILSDTYGPGNAGNISIIAEESLIVNGSLDSNFLRSQISSSAMPTGPFVGGDSGNISIKAKNVIIENGGFITSSTNGYYAIQSGRAGNISLEVSDTIRISGVNPYGTDSSDYLRSSGIFVGSGGPNNSGEAGAVLLKSGTLIIEKGGLISANTIGNISGGNIDIHVRNQIHITGDSSSEEFIPGQGFQIFQNSSIMSSSRSTKKDSGPGGSIFLSSDRLILDNKGTISTASEGGGNAGNIMLDINHCSLRNDAQISSASNHDTYGGLAGTIHIEAADSIHLSDNSKLTTEAVHSRIDNNNDALSGKISLAPGRLLFLSNSEISTSVKGGSGKGGDIDISQPQLVSLNKSKIIANAYKGSGGNIVIDSDQFIQSADSIVIASSRLGVNGNIDIKSPVINITGDLNAIVENNMDVEQWVKTPCEARLGINVSQFIITDLDASPIDYYDCWLTLKENELNQEEKDIDIDHQLVDDYIKKYFDFFESY